MGNPVVHWELWSADPAKLSKFYEAAFDWKIQPYPELNYHMADTDGPAEMLDAAAEALRGGHNQYPPGPGIPVLRAAIAAGTTLGREAQTYMDRGALVPDEIVLGMVAEKLAQIAAAEPPLCGALFDGFPRTLPQAEGLDAALARIGQQIDRVVNLDAPRAVLIERVTGRVTCAKCGTIYNLRTDPYEFATVTSNTYDDWMMRHAFVIYVAQAAAAKFAETFKDFPRVQKPNTFTVDDALARSRTTLAEVFRKEGYVTAAWVANPVIDPRVFFFNQGFDRWVDVRSFEERSRRLHLHDMDPNAADITEAVLPWLEAHRRDRFFLYLHSLDLHYPYVARPPFDARFVSSESEGLDRDRELYDAELEKLKGKGLGPRDLGVPAARACMQKGDAEAAIAWLQSIPARFRPMSLATDPVFVPIKDRADFKALFESR